MLQACHMYISPYHAQEQLNNILTSGWEVLDSRKACGCFSAAWLEHSFKECVAESSDVRLQDISPATVEEVGSYL